MISLYPFKHAGSRLLIKRLWQQYLYQYRWTYVIAILCMIIVGSTTAILIKLIEPTLDLALIKKDFDLIMWLALIFLVVSFIRGSANYIQTILLSKIGLKVILKIKIQMFSALTKMDLIDIHDQGTAHHLARFSSDVNVLRVGLTKAFTGIGRDCSILIFMIVTMFTLNWQMALGAFLFFPSSVWPVIKIGRRMRKVTYNTQNEMAQMTATLDDSLKGTRQVRAYNLQMREHRRVTKHFIKIFRLTLKQTMIRTLTHPIMDTLSGATIAAMLLWGGYLILQNNLTVGQFMAFFIAVGAAYQPARSLANINSTIQESLAAAQRIFSLIDKKPSIYSPPKSPELKIKKGEIIFKNVNFSYSGSSVDSSQKPLFENLNIQFDGCKKTALVGMSGGGKSTILNLIPRFFDINDGQILIDGQDIKNVHIKSLRNHIALVSQENTLFDMSIEDNIACAKLNADLSEIIGVAKRAYAHDFICQLKDGYQTQIGEQGIKLSGGQRQRITIARAMLKNAPILLLDEATSALDNESEAIVQQALYELMQNRTVLVIAHRLSTVRQADRILVIDHGKIVESGHHDQLINANGYYAKLCRSQNHF
ncbi:MAG: ABC transporter transmembrane domain-containing protein [Pseudomonadota bacterium]